MKRILLILAVLLSPVAAWAQNPVTITPMEGTPADAESNTEPFLGRVGMRGYFFNGSTWDRMRGDTTSGLWANVKAVPADPFGVNADAASATGSISAKLRFIASTGIPVTGSVTVTNAGTFAVQAAQTTSPWIVAGGGTAGSAATGVVTVQGIASMTKLLVTPDSVALPANQSVNVAQLAGTTTDTNSGNKSAGTLRVVLATDQPALTNKLLVTPDANSAVNVAQMNGVTVTMGNGVAGTGVQRVAVASDNTTFTTAPVATATTTDGVITTNCYITSAASTNSTNCKASAGNVYFVHVTNTTTTNYFLRLYNSSSAPTCSSATGFVETIPALGATANGGVNGRVNVIPQSFATGIGFCLTGGGSSTDNTNAATGVYVTIGYK